MRNPNKLKSEILQAENILENSYSINHNTFLKMFAKVKLGISLGIIKIRNQHTRKFENINFNREYTVLLSDKYLVKDTANIKCPAKIRDKFKEIPETYDSLLRKYLEMINYDVRITDKTREERIL